MSELAIFSLQDIRKTVNELQNNVKNLTTQTNTPLIDSVATDVLTKIETFAGITNTRIATLTTFID